MDAETKLLIDRATDAVRLCEQRNIPKFVGFLSTAEAAVIAKNVKTPLGCFYGGAAESERTVFGVFPEYITDRLQAFPISVIDFTFPKQYALSHRDVLGALMSTGIVRAKVGDICFAEGHAFVFVLSDIADYIIAQVCKIKNVGVKGAVVDLGQPAAPSFGSGRQAVRFTVASMRLDAVLCALTNLSRSKCEKAVSEGLVSVNSFEVTKPEKRLLLNDVIALRGTGKFKITKIGEVTRKGKISVFAEKYI